MPTSLGITDTPSPRGFFHVAAMAEDGNMRIVEAWDSRKQAEA